MHEPQYAVLSFPLTRTILFFKKATSDSPLKHNIKITYRVNYVLRTANSQSEVEIFSLKEYDTEKSEKGRKRDKKGEGEREQIDSLKINLIRKHNNFETQVQFLQDKYIVEV